MTESHPLVVLARQAIQQFIRHGKRLEKPDEFPDEFERPAGAFVTIRRQGSLRGCIGTIEPTCPTVAEEVIRNAISAATHDYRFSPVTVDELDGLEVKVDVLSEMEPVAGLDQLDPKRYGLLVQSKLNPGKRGCCSRTLRASTPSRSRCTGPATTRPGLPIPMNPSRCFASR